MSILRGLWRLLFGSPGSLSIVAIHPGTMRTAGDAPLVALPDSTDLPVLLTQLPCPCEECVRKRSGMAYTMATPVGWN